MEDSTEQTNICTHCNKENDDSLAKCEKWLQKCSLSDVESVVSNFTDDTSSFITESESDRQDSITDLCPIVPGESVNCGDVKITHSKHVIIGNKTIIRGPVYITSQNTINQTENKIEQVFLNATGNMKLARKPLRIIARRDWLAQPPISRTPLTEPVKYVAICSDGLVYEGRGWGQKGAFAFSYNRKSVGIAFVGCFMDHLPSSCALLASQDLINKGVELGHIPPDYTLVGHCQCSAVESPGKILYEEIKTWKGWRELNEFDEI